MMDEQKAYKVFDLISKGDDLSRDEVKFLENNLAPFSELLIQAGTHAMTQAGMEKDEALSILETLAMVSRMAGASNFVDYVATTRIMEG
jgi:hypothetical protein